MHEIDERLDLSWEARARRLLPSNRDSGLACLFEAITEHRSFQPPGFGNGMWIDEDGLCWTQFIDHDRNFKPKVALGSTEQLKGQWNDLGDRIKATDEERDAMFARLRKWVVYDLRAMLAPDESITALQ